MGNEIVGFLLIDPPASALYGTAEDAERWIAELDGMALRYADYPRIQEQLRHARAQAVEWLQARPTQR